MFVFRWYLFLSLLCTSLLVDGQKGVHMNERHTNADTIWLKGDSVSVTSRQQSGDQLMLVLRRIHEDREGNLWFVGDGVFVYDGYVLHDLSEISYFKGRVVRQIMDGPKGSLYFATSDGIIQYDVSNGEDFEDGRFTYWNHLQGLVDNDVWGLCVDSNGDPWVGTLRGVSKYKTCQFESFILPKSYHDRNRGVSSNKMVRSIIKDRSGNLWFGSNGGAYKYDERNLSNLSEVDGMSNNVINHILEDRQGNFWFATHYGGLCFWDGHRFKHFILERNRNTEVWSIYEDSKGHIWFPVENAGVFRYDGQDLKQFIYEDGLVINGIHTIVEDSKGYIWMGGFNGLYRFNGKRFVQVTKNKGWVRGATD